MHIDLHNTKTQYAIGGIIVALALLGWYIFGQSSSDDGANLVESNSDPIESVIGRELLASLEKMKGVTLDTSFVSDPVFNSLIDMTVEVPTLEKGRRDPFAPISSD